MAGTDQRPIYFVTAGGAPAPSNPQGAVAVVACPDCKALVAQLDLDDHQDKAHGQPG